MSLNIRDEEFESLSKFLESTRDITVQLSEFKHPEGCAYLIFSAKDSSVKPVVLEVNIDE